MGVCFSLLTHWVWTQLPYEEMLATRSDCTFIAAKGVGPRLATRRRGQGKECHLEQVWGHSPFHVRCRWQGKCWSGKHRTLETMHMEGEQNPEDYIRVKPTPTNQNISAGDRMQRRNVWLTNQSIFLKQERKEGRKGEREKEWRKEIKKGRGEGERKEEERKEKEKKSPYCVSSLYQPRSFVSHFTFCSGYY